MNTPKSLKTAAALAVFSLTLAICAVLIYSLYQNTVPKESPRVSVKPQSTVVIDAGHGGTDGGCVSVKLSIASTDLTNDILTSASNNIDNGSNIVSSPRYDVILEKDCNLAISKIIAALFKVSGYNVVMTRETDIMLDQEGMSGTAKMRDLKTRLDIASRYPDAIFISIHCNKYPSTECKGLQVYYSKNNESSAEIAQGIQNSVITMLQPENHRAVKAADSSIYILDRATQPAVLVECGFLSNPEEATLLASEDYQKQLALSIVLPLLI